ncbi:30S ribosomal protein S7 [bacterium HR34]|nr:30S ribosomal protein S7 [bacterium HR34]
MKVEIKPDPKYNSVLVEKFVNQIMKNGKKSVARKIVYNCFEIIKNTTKKDPLEVFEKAIKNVGPLVEVRPKRIGGATYQVPFPVSEKRRISLAMKWIRDIARKKKGKGMAEKLAQEIIDASNNIGAAVKKKEDTHKMAEANKAFAHFAS